MFDGVGAAFFELLTDRCELPDLPERHIVAGRKNLVTDLECDRVVWSTEVFKSGDTVAQCVLRC